MNLDIIEIYIECQQLYYLCKEWNEKLRKRTPINFPVFVWHVSRYIGIAYFFYAFLCNNSHTLQQLECRNIRYSDCYGCLMKLHLTISRSYIYVIKGTVNKKIVLIDTLHAKKIFPFPESLVEGIQKTTSKFNEIIKS